MPRDRERKLTALHWVALSAKKKVLPAWCLFFLLFVMVIGILQNEFGNRLIVYPFDPDGQYDS